MTKKKKPEEENPKNSKDLSGFEIKVNSFGELEMDLPIDEINEFLNENVEDKKIKKKEKK